MSAIPLPFDSTTFRRTLGMFATGITVITTRNREGKLFGLTVNSFNSVSLTPPLVVWSLNTSSGAREAFETSNHHAINVLAENQQAVSNLFAGRHEDRFGQVSWEPGLDGVPLLAGCCAVLEVRNRRHWEEGDHIMFIGEVVRCERSEAAPLLYFNGAYHALK